LSSQKHNQLSNYSIKQGEVQTDQTEELSLSPLSSPNTIQGQDGSYDHQIRCDRHQRWAFTQIKSHTSVRFQTLQETAAACIAYPAKLAAEA